MFASRAIQHFVLGYCQACLQLFPQRAVREFARLRGQTEPRTRCVNHTMNTWFLIGRSDGTAT